MTGERWWISVETYPLTRSTDRDEIVAYGEQIANALSADPRVTDIAVSTSQDGKDEPPRGNLSGAFDGDVRTALATAESVFADAVGGPLNEPTWKQHRLGEGPWSPNEVEA